jgi:aminopeptidase N
MTVYEKGAEVVRMQHTLLGEERFQKGMKLYFERHDGQAVTCDDFVQAMQDASGVDLAQFKRWYDVAGTPILDCRGEYADGTFTLHVKQSMNPPFHLPLAVKVGTQEAVLSVRKLEEEFKFTNLKSKPVPSLLRGFSAPVILNYPYTEAELIRLMAEDDDAFNRWEAGQRLMATIILERAGEPSPAFIEACARVLEASAADPAFAAEALSLPAESFLAEQMHVVDPDALHAARNALRRRIAEALRAPLLQAYRANETKGPYSPDAASAGRRALRSLCLGFLMELADDEVRALCLAQYEGSDNMTETFAALGLLANCDCPEREPALARFYEKWRDESLVIDKWLAVQATSRLPGTLARVRELLAHPSFDIRVPNKVYALIRAFAANHVRFHAADGAGYEFLADQVLALDRLNPQVAARMARSFDRWKRFDPARQALAGAQLARIRDAQGLSRDVAEIVSKALA